MNKSEFAILASAIKTYYPKEGLFPTKESMELWYRMLADIPYDAAENAVNRYVASNKFPPTIADIREYAAMAKLPEVADWSEAWEKARKAVRKFGSYQKEEALEWLDPVTAEAVKRFGYMDLCMMENPEVAKAQFRDIYNQIAKRKKADAQIPAALNAFIEDARKLIGGGA